jgi:nucleotide-binding universal stress UspA family protein
VVTVWEPRAGFEGLTPIMPPAPIDIRAALEIDESLYEGAQRMAEQGAATARQLGVDAEGLAVADVLTVAETLVRIARERDAPAMVVGTRGYGPVREILLSSTARDVIRKARANVTTAAGTLVPAAASSPQSAPQAQPRRRPGAPGPRHRLRQHRHQPVVLVMRADNQG